MTNRISIHTAPDKDAIEQNKKREPLGEQIRAELVGLLKRYGIVSVSLDTDEHCVSIDINKLPPEIKPVLTQWGSIYVRNEPWPSGEIWEDTEPVHLWFNLSYAQYLTIPRTVLQSMPQEWQARFVKCLCELDAAIDWRPEEGCYWVKLKDHEGRYMSDPFADYERGRRRLPLNAKSEEKSS